MTLKNLKSGFKRRSFVLHFRCLLGSLGHHFGRFGGPFWEPKSFIVGAWGGPWHPQKTNPEKEPKKDEKDQRCHSILEAILDPFSNDF